MLSDERDDEMTAFELCTGPVGYRNGHEAATERLLPLLEQAIEVMYQVGLARCPSYIAHPQAVWFDEHVQSKAREFLAKIKEPKP